MSITPLPDPPSRQDPNNFAARADALLAALVQFVTECNATAATMTAQTTSATSSAATATTKAGEAGAARDIAMAAVNYKGLWSSLSGALAIPASVYHSGSIWMLTQNVASVAAETPGVSSKWINVTPASGLGSAAYQNSSAFQPAIGALTGLLKSAGAGTISAATAAEIVAAIGAAAVAKSTNADWATGAGSANTIADGAVSSAAKIADSIITWAKMVAINTGKLLGRTTAGSGQAEEIAIGTGLSMSGNVLNCTVSPPVTSVAGKAGAVSLTPGDVGAAPAAHSHSNYAGLSAFVAVSTGTDIEGYRVHIFTRADGTTLNILAQ